MVEETTGAVRAWLAVPTVADGLETVPVVSGFIGSFAEKLVVIGAGGSTNPFAPPPASCDHACPGPTSSPAARIKMFRVFILVLPGAG